MSEAVMVKKKPRSNSLWADAWRRLRKNRMAVACGAIFLFMCMFSFAGPLLAEWFAGVDGLSQDARLGATAPSWSHWFGTDQLGRDMLVRTMQGGRLAIIVAITATAMSMVIGVIFGATAGYVGGRTDNAMMRFVDIMYAFPTLVFVIVIAAVLDSKSIVLVFALIGAVSWLTWPASFAARCSRSATASSSRRPAASAPPPRGSCSATSCRTPSGRWWSTPPRPCPA
jgi:oligopeptide transport system permease protein